MPEEYICNFCDHIYKTKNGLTNHIKMCNKKNIMIKKHKEEKARMRESLKKKYLKQQSILEEDLQKKHQTVVEELKRNRQLNEQDLIKEYENKLQVLRIKLKHAHEMLSTKEKYTETLLENTEKYSDTLLSRDHDHITHLHETNQHYKTIVDNAGKLVTESMSTFNKIVRQFDSAPAIKAFSNFDSILDTVNDNDDYDLADIMIHQNDKKKLGVYLGNIIIKEYKKDNPFSQSLWTTDAHRFTYAVRESENDNISWTRDKGANKIREIIIDPLTTFVMKIMKEKIFKCNKIISMSSNLYGLDMNDYSSDSYSDSDDDSESDPDLGIKYNKTNDDVKKMFLGDIKNKKYTYKDIEPTDLSRKKATDIITNIINGRLDKEILQRITNIFFPDTNSLANAITDS